MRVWPLLLAASALALPAHAGGIQLVEQTLQAEGQMLHTLVRDLDGDGRNELLVVARRGRPARPVRTLYVWKSGPDGFSSTPSATLQIPADTVAVDACDVDPARGTEIITLGSRGLSAFVQQSPLTFATKPRQVVEQRSSLAFPDKTDAPFVELCRFPQGAAGPELWVPTWNGVQVFRLEDGKPTADALLKVYPLADHMVADEFRGPRARRDYSVLTTLAFPQLHSIDADNDGDDDVYATIEDRVWLFLRDGGRLQGVPAARKFFGVRTAEDFRADQNRLQVSFGDVTGDKLPDAVVVKCTGRISDLHTQLRVYPGRGARGFGSKYLDQRDKDGYAVPEAVIDLDGDGVAEILEPYLNTGPASVAQLVMTLTIDMEFHALRIKNNRFVEGEEMELEFGFEFGGSGVKGTLPLFGRDIDGDGISDRVDLGLGDKALVFLGRKGNPAYDDDEDWEREVEATRKAAWYWTREGAPASILIFRPKDKDLGGTITVLWNKKGQ